MPSASAEAVESNTRLNGVLPCWKLALATAVGAWFGLTVMVTVVESVSPSTSETVSVVV